MLLNSSRRFRGGRGRALVVVLVACVAMLPSAARATWSIVLMDTTTKEIAIGSATCLPGLDLTLLLPIVVVDTGAAAAQALVDSTLGNQTLIRDGLLNSVAPSDILATLEADDPAYQQRQFGIIHYRRDPATHTGAGNGPFASAVSGRVGSVIYSIQGNVLTGAAVIDAIEQVVLTGTGGLPEQLMAGMEAARQMGGDGRCSCTPINPTSCGSPPLSFEKAAHIGFMIVARTGDTSNPCSLQSGCASGDFYMRLNVANQVAVDPDPVFQLRTQFDAWRQALVGRPDAIASVVTFDPPALTEMPSASGTMTITLRDHLADIVTAPILSVTVAHAPGSAGIATIGPVNEIATGVYEVAFSGDLRAGLDMFRVVVDDGTRNVTLIPPPEVVWAVPADTDVDGDVDRADFGAWRECLDGPGVVALPPCESRDFDGDASVTLRDYGDLQASFTDEPCVELLVDVVDVELHARCDFPFTLTAPGIADPPARYQWFLDGVPIPGATGATYSVGATTGADLGVYRVDVSNTCGTIRSGAFDLQPVSPCP